MSEIPHSNEKNENQNNKEKKEKDDDLCCLGSCSRFFCGYNCYKCKCQWKKCCFCRFCFWFDKNGADKVDCAEFIAECLCGGCQ